MKFAQCKDPIWGRDDFSTCFEQQYVAVAVTVTVNRPHRFCTHVWVLGMSPTVEAP
jgi:hypothetical protein